GRGRAEVSTEDLMFDELDFACDGCGCRWRLVPAMVEQVACRHNGMFGCPCGYMNDLSAKIEEARIPPEPAPTRADIDIDDLFSYHRLTPAQLDRFDYIRGPIKVAAAAIMANCPGGADRTTAIRKLRECLMTANASIALDRK
ncbi:MAG: hypothetical protein NUW22_13580, partial [Acidobacteria bacterium]|nr:hypothetical protein [Acidobacteriota bacterium]